MDKKTRNILIGVGVIILILYIFSQLDFTVPKLAVTSGLSVSCKDCRELPCRLYSKPRSGGGETFCLESGADVGSGCSTSRWNFKENCEQDGECQWSCPISDNDCLALEGKGDCTSFDSIDCLRGMCDVGDDSGCINNKICGKAEGKGCCMTVCEILERGGKYTNCEELSGGACTGNDRYFCREGNLLRTFNTATNEYDLLCYFTGQYVKPSATTCPNGCINGKCAEQVCLPNAQWCDKSQPIKRVLQCDSSGNTVTETDICEPDEVCNELSWTEARCEGFRYYCTNNNIDCYWTEQFKEGKCWNTERDCLNNRIVFCLNKEGTKCIERRGECLEGERSFRGTTPSSVRQSCENQIPGGAGGCQKCGEGLANVCDINECHALGCWVSDEDKPLIIGTIDNEDCVQKIKVTKDCDNKNINSCETGYCKKVKMEGLVNRVVYGKYIYTCSEKPTNYCKYFTQFETLPFITGDNACNMGIGILVIIGLSIFGIGYYSFKKTKKTGRRK